MKWDHQTATDDEKAVFDKFEERVVREIATALCVQAGEDPECIEFETHGGRHYAKWENYKPQAKVVFPIVVNEMGKATTSPIDSTKPKENSNNRLSP